MSDFANIADVGGTFAKTELDTGVDFTNQVSIAGVFVTTTLDEGVDFSPSGDAGVIVVSGTGFGEGGFGEGPFGGTISYTLTHPMTVWTYVTTP